MTVFKFVGVVYHAVLLICHSEEFRHALPGRRVCVAQTFATSKVCGFSVVAFVEANRFIALGLAFLCVVVGACPEPVEGSVLSARELPLSFRGAVCSSRSEEQRRGICISFLRNTLCSSIFKIRASCVESIHANAPAH
jgi:hypothetical protein